MGRTMKRIFWIVLLSNAVALAAEMNFLLDAQRTQGAIERSRAVWKRTVGEDATLAALAKKNALNVTIKKRDGVYLLMAGPLPQNEETALLGAAHYAIDHARRHDS